MSHCHDCNSSYDTPGTCNCFAFGGKRALQIGPWVPTPMPPGPAVMPPLATQIPDHVPEMTYWRVVPVDCSPRC